MSTAEKIMYVCDRCGDEEDAEEVDEQELWIMVEGKHYCSTCWRYL